MEKILFDLTPSYSQSRYNVTLGFYLSNVLFKLDDYNRISKAGKNRHV